MKKIIEKFPSLESLWPRRSLEFVLGWSVGSTVSRNMNFGVLGCLDRHFINATQHLIYDFDIGPM